LAQRAAREPAPAPCLKSFRLGAELGMCCGGSVDVLLEPLVARVPCLVVGGGHVATAVVPILGRLGFAVTVCDEREDMRWRPASPVRRSFSVRGTKPAPKSIAAARCS
jgi:xanthine dehydrogenase accessory factor